MMSFNPELQRNVWLQMSWARLFVAPILIGILLAGILSTIKLDPEAVAEAARWGFVLLLALWRIRWPRRSAAAPGKASACRASPPGR